jgi:hypothetical protein
MGYSPIKLDKISQYLMYYPKKEESKMIYDGFPSSAFFPNL